MKKLLMFLFLMTISLGQSQNLRLGFESGESGNANGPFGGFSIQPVEAGSGSNTSMVLPIVANPTGQIWQGCNFVLTTPVMLTTSKTMTIDVLSSEPVTFLLKVNGGVAGAAEAAAQASHNGDGTWQTISFTFNTSLDGKAATANGIYNNMVLHPFFPFTGSASARTFYIDNISGPQAIVAPTISNFSISAKSVGDSFELTAPTSNSAGAFTYTSSNTNIATISGSTVSVLSAGNTTITATQAANGSYSEGSITATFTASNLIIPTIGTLTVPAKNAGDAAFDLSAPSSDSAGAFTYTSSNTAVATISGSTVTIVGLGSSTITATQAADGAYDTGSVTATLTVTVPNAPTPANDSADVISIFSDTYTNLSGTDFFPNWGQSTQFVSVNGTLKYSNLNYQGNQFAAPVDASAMQNLHIDIWTPDCTSFQVFLISPGSESPVTLTPTLSGWNSYDIPLSSYPAVNKANLIQFKYVGSGTVYLDNLYFWKVPAGTYTYYADADGDGYGAGAASLSTETTAPAGYSVNNTDCNDANAAVNPGATEVLNSIDDDCDGLTDEGLLPTIPTTDAPTAPVRNAWDVISLYSSVYTNIGSNFFPNWGQATTFSNYTPVSDEAIKYSNLTYQGIEIVSGNAPVNVSAMTKLHLDVWTPDLTSFQVVLIAGGEKSVTLTPTQSGWNSYDLDLATQYAGSNLTAAIQFKLERTLWTPTDGNVNSLYLDNIYFYRPATTQPPTLGTFTVPAKVVSDASFDLTAPTSNGSGTFTYTSSNTAVATISGSTVTIVGAGSSTITATQAADETYSSASVIATLVVSLDSAAPTPTIPADRVLSIYSGAAGYSNAAGTNFYPNWGQATQYAEIDVVGNPTLRYSNLNYQGIQLGSILDISSYDSIHLNVYGGGTSSLNFRVINQVGGAGSTDVERVAATQITLNPGWNSVVIPVSSLTTATPGFELNRVGQLAFVGSGTIYVDNIFFSKAVPTAVAPTVANIAFCKGSASALTAVASGTNSLKWYTAATGGTALASAPTPTATKTYYVSQVMSNGTESPRAMIVATINNLPATPSALTSLEAKNICKFIGTTTPILFSAVATGASSYIWTAPEGASVTNDGAQANISFENVSTTAGSIGSVTVKIVDANGCISLPKALALTTVLPKAPASITLTSADTATDFNVSGVPSSLSTLAKITKVGPYIGTSTVFTLTAPEATTAASYSWTLPNGVNQLTGGSSNQITIDFADVAPGITSLPIAVKSVAGCGNSTDKTLTLVRTLPSAPTKLVLTEGASTTAITKVGAYTGKPTELTLTATPILVQGATATSYAWVLPAGVVCTSDHTTGAIVTGSTTTEGVTTPWTIDNAIATTSGTITIDFSGVNTGVLSFPLSVYAVNGSGNSKAKTLTVTAAAPATPSIVGSGGNGTAVQFGTCSTKTYTATLIPGATYNWTVPAGAVIVGESDGNSIEVDYSATSVAVNASSTVTCSASNGTGTSAVKSLSVKRVACTSTKLAKDSSTDDFNVIAYPNPSSSDFTIETTSKGAMSVKVYDLQGRLVEKANTDKVGSNLAKGIYNVIVNQGANTKTVRVIKK